MNILIKYLLLLLFITSYSFANYNLEEKEFIKNHPIITVGVEENWPPFDFVENGKYKGLAKDYLDLISEKTNLDFKYVVDKWSNLLEKAKNKEIDLLPILAKTSSREKFLVFTKKYLTVRDYVYSKDSRTNIKSVSDFNGKTVALPRNYFQVDYFKENYPDTKIYLTNNILETIDAVITNKADFLVSNNAIMSYTLNKYNINEIDAKFNLGYEGSIFHMATRNDYQILRNIIEKAIMDISFVEKKDIFFKWVNINDTVNNKESLALTKEEITYIKRKKTISVGNVFDWKPFDFFEDNKPKGYVVDYVKLIANKISLEPLFITNNWSILIEQSKKGEIDLLPVLSYNKKREEYLNFTQSFMTQDISIITKTSTNDIINIDDLVEKKVGMIKSWNLTNIIKKTYPKMNVIEFESEEDIYNAIRDNFIDATIQNTLLANYFINKNYYGELKIGSNLSIKGFTKKLFMGVKKDDLILHNLIEKAISSVTKEELKILDDKWINTSKKIDFNDEEKKFIKTTTIQVSSVGNFAPFGFIENDKINGINIDFWKYIVDKAKLKTNLSIDNKPYEILDFIKNKEKDIFISGNKTKEKEKYSIFSKTFLSSSIGIATLHNKNYIKDESQLLFKTIGVRKNSSIHEMLNSKYPKINFKFVTTVEEGLKLLSENKIYALVDAMPALTYNIKKYGYSNIKISGQTSFKFDMNFIIRDDYFLLKSIIDKVLISMTREEKDNIYNKWIKIAFEEKVDYSLTLKIVGFFILILIYILYRNRQMSKYQKSLEISQKETEKSLKNFKTLIDLNIAGILIIRDQKIKYINSECIKILGYKSENELINKNISLIFNMKKIDEIYELLKEVNSYEITAIKSDKSLIPVLLKGKKTEFDNLASYIISLVDLTEIKNKEKLLLEQSKLASLGEMIGNIAHQWRQPLSAISTTASGAKLQKEFGQLEDKNFNEAMDTITKTSKFLSQTIDDFRDYIKDNKEKRHFNVNSSLKKVLSIMEGSFKTHFIQVKNDVKDLEITSYENEFTQALLNILSNSKDALKNTKEEDRRIFINSSQIQNNLILEIIDTGGGINENIIEKVFEPYFTTKHKSQGTGLGLYMTHKIIKESMNSDIIIENCAYQNYNNCTKVTLIIPIN